MINSVNLENFMLSRHCEDKKTNLKTEAPIVLRASFIRWFLSPLLTCKRREWFKHGTEETEARRYNGDWVDAYCESMCYVHTEFNSNAY